MSSKESTEQGKSGKRGAEAERVAGGGKQPRQGSDRVENRPDTEEPKHHFAEGSRPSEQGETGSPSPARIAANQQGLSGGGTGRKGSSGADTDRSEEVAQEGSPASGHTRQGRQGVPGDRAPRGNS